MNKRREELANTSAAGAAASTGASAGVGDPLHSFLMVMMQMLTTMSENGSRNVTKNTRYEECPVKRKCISLEAWMDEVNESSLSN